MTVAEEKVREISDKLVNRIDELRDEGYPDAGKYYASLFEDVEYDGGKHTWKLATLITYSVDDMLEAFKELGIVDNRIKGYVDD